MLREFFDDLGRRWRVWDVKPTLHSRPSRALARVMQQVPSGWLAFETDGERRRLAPIPPEWDRCDEQRLAALCASAESVPPQRNPR